MANGLGPLHPSTFPVALHSALGGGRSFPQDPRSASPLVVTRLDDRPFFTTQSGAMGPLGTVGTRFTPTGSLHVTTPARAGLIGYQSAPGAGVQSFAPGALEGLRSVFGFEGTRLDRGLADTGASTFSAPTLAGGGASPGSLAPSWPLLAVAGAALFVVLLVARK